MSVDLADTGGGLGESQIVVLIDQTVDFGFVKNLGFATTEELDAAFNSTSSGLNSKVDKVGGTIGTPWIKLVATGTKDQNPNIAPVEFATGSGQFDLRLQGNRIILDPNYSVRFTSPNAEFAAGIGWDMGGQSVALSGCGIFSVTTSSANTKVFDCGTGKDNVLRSYDNSKQTTVIGANGMSVPIFSVKRVSGTVTSTVFQINDVPKPTASSITTLSQLLSALVTLGIIDP